MGPIVAGIYVPYLDQRGISLLWDYSYLGEVKPAIWASDSMEAGLEGFKGWPPANTVGTPNDTVRCMINLHACDNSCCCKKHRVRGRQFWRSFPMGPDPRY
mmetsp:Transcript_17575/g.19726  ORF Transcript_17575/g.19726 Transcript_17575/m.19726 type:complete len:101 (+) Transcript_17575:509-811(+)